MIKVIKYSLLLLIIGALISVAWLFFSSDKTISDLSNSDNHDDNINVTETPAISEQTSKPDDASSENLKSEKLIENTIDQTDGGADEVSKNDEISIEAVPTQTIAESGNEAIPQIRTSTDSSSAGQNSSLKNLDNIGSQLNDDGEAINQTNQPPPNSTKIQKEPISLLWLSLIFSLVVNILVILLLFQQMRRRKNIFNGQEVLMPEQWVSSLADRMMGVSKALGELVELSKVNYKSINEISAISESFNKVIDSKEEEIKRFRKGYDEHIYDQFLSKFINITEAVKRLTQKDDVTKDDFENIHFRLTDALDDCGVFIEAVEIGSLYSELGDLVEDNPRTINTDNEEQNLRVAEVQRAAYLVSSSEGNKVILPAKVAIFVKN